MDTVSLSVGRRSPKEWLSSLPTLIVLLLTIFLASGEVIHSQLLKIGENTWEGYFKLRTAGLVGEPTCNPDPDMERSLQEAVARKKAHIADDPLAGLFGTDNKTSCSDEPKHKYDCDLQIGRLILWKVQAQCIGYKRFDQRQEFKEKVVGEPQYQNRHNPFT